MSIFQKIGAWFKKAFTNVKKDGAKIAITITQGIKVALADGVLPAIASVVDGVTGGHIGAEAITLLNANIYKALAFELAIQGLPDNPTEADIKAFGDAAIKAMTGLDPTGKSKLYTTVASQIYGIIQTDVNKGVPLTFAQLVADVEEAYQDYQQDLADEADTSTNMN